MSMQPTVVTPELKTAILDWYRQKQAIGTYKAKARELGLNHRTMEDIIFRHRNKEVAP